MRFKLDEHFPVEATMAFRSAGHDAETVDDEGLSGSPDVKLAAICKGEGRAIITMDLGFSDIRSYPPAESPGLVVLRPNKQDKRAVVALIERFLKQLGTNDITGKLWIVDQERIRVRD